MKQPAFQIQFHDPNPPDVTACRLAQILLCESGTGSAGVYLPPPDVPEKP